MELRPMHENEFRTYIEKVIKDYAEEQVKAGSWRVENAPEMSKNEIQALLPDGLNTKDHFFYSMIITGEPSPVGVLWIMLRDRNTQKEAFINDIEIYESYRRKGYAGEGLALLEAILQGMGIHRIRLQVFGHNQQAIALYRKTGYEVINIYMEKQI